MLSGSCNKWGKYLCSYGYTKVEDSEDKNKVVLANEFYTYDGENCPAGKSKKSNKTRGIGECTQGMTVPPQDDPRCTLTSLIEEDEDELQRAWFDGNEVDSDKMVRVGCATSSLDSISIFGRRSSRSGSALDLDTLERILNQDAPEYATKNRYNRNSDGIYEKVKYCGLTEKGYRNLKNAIDRKSLPKDRVCMSYDKLINEARLGFIAVSAGESTNGTVISEVNDAETCKTYGERLAKDGCTTKPVYEDPPSNKRFSRCEVVDDEDGCFWDGDFIRKKTSQEICVSSGGTYNGNKCECDADKDLQLQADKCVGTKTKVSKINNLNQAGGGRLPSRMC